MQVGDFECTKYKDLVNAHLPIPELNRYVAMKIFLVCNSVEGIVLQETWHVLVLMMLKTLFNRKEANELCSKFGSDVFMAGEINSQLDFDEYYKVVVSLLTINKSSQNASVIARF